MEIPSHYYKLLRQIMQLQLEVNIICNVNRHIKKFKDLGKYILSTKSKYKSGIAPRHLILIHGIQRKYLQDMEEILIGAFS